MTADLVELLTGITQRMIFAVGRKGGKMSEENGKVCCNCRHCIRSRDENYNIVVCRCEVYDRYLSYAEVMASCCERWAKEQEGENETD